MRLIAFVFATLFSLAAFSGVRAQTTQIVAISGQDQLALHDLATGKELARFEAVGGSRDVLALERGMLLANHTAGNSVLQIDLRDGTLVTELQPSRVF
jgi:hypothetical protein